MKRRGMTIIEVTIAVTLAVVVLGTLTITVSRLLLSSGSAQDHLQDLTALGRLGEQFRGDAHAASTVRIVEGEPRQLVFGGDGDSTISYTIVPEGLDRVEQAADQVRSRERFVMTGLVPLGWKLEGESSQVALEMGRLTRPREADEIASGRFSIAAALPRRSQPASAAPAEEGARP